VSEGFRGFTTKEGVMKKTLRLLLLATAAAVGLAFAAPALAAYNPSLTVEQTSYKLGASTTVDLFLVGGENDDPSARIQIFSPAGYGSNLSQAPGTKLGTALALAKSAELGGAVVPIPGNVLVGNRSDPTLMAQSAQCTGSPSSQAIWILDLNLQGTGFQIPTFVNVIGSHVVVQACLPPPDKLPLKAQLIGLDANVRGVFTNASTRGGYQWAGDFTPYAGSVPNAAGTVEWRTYVGLPQSLTLKRGKNKAGKRTVTGKLTIAGLNPAGVRLYVYAGRKPRPAPNATSAGTGKIVGRTRPLKSKGTYTFRLKVKRTTYVQTRFENYGLAGSCQGPSPSGLPIPCHGTDLAPVSSNQLRLTPIKRRR
jgi:hypothetical protein